MERKSLTIRLRNSAVFPHCRGMRRFSVVRMMFFCAVISFLIFCAVFSHSVFSSQNTSASRGEETSETVFSPDSAESPFSQKMHPWGNFEPGAWRLSRMSTEVFTQSQKSENITTTDNCVTLQKTEADIFSLVVESMVTLAGKSVKMEPQMVFQGPHGLLPAESQGFRILRQEMLFVNGQPIPCYVVQFSFSGEKTQKTAIFWLNQSRSPYIFRKEIQVRDSVSGKSEEFTRTEITSLNCQVVVFGKIFKGYRSKIESEFPQRAVSTTVVSSPDIPGGVVSRFSRETDLQGHVLQVATTELVDFGLKEGEHQNELFRNNPIRVARPTVIRPSVDVASIGEVEFILDFSKSQVPAVGSAEQPDLLTRIRDRFAERRERENAGTSAKKEGSGLKIFKKPEESSEESEDVLKGYFAQPRLVNQDVASPPFAPLVAVKETVPRKPEKKSPLYQLREKGLRKKRVENPKNVAILETADAGRGVSEKKVELIDLYSRTADSEPQKDNRARSSWRGHWRAAIIGN